MHGDSVQKFKYIASVAPPEVKLNICLRWCVGISCKNSNLGDFQCYGVCDWLSNLQHIASTVIAINSRIRNLRTSLFIRVLSLQDFVGCLSNWNQVEGASISAVVRLAVIFGRLICHSSHNVAYS